MKKLLPILLCLACFGTLRAQAPDELDAFQRASGDESVLFRGKQATRINFPANGNPYWESPEFVNGEVVFEGNLYRNVLLNIDASEQRALVQKSYGLLAVALIPESTSSLTIGGRPFVGVGPGEALPEGFYEVFGTGPEHVYKHVQKTLSNSVDNMNGDGIGYYDDAYRSDVFRYFAIKTTYYFVSADGEVSRIKSKGALLRKFRDRKKEIRKSLKAAGMNEAGVGFEAYCKAVLNAAAQ